LKIILYNQDEKLTEIYIATNTVSECLLPLVDSLNLYNPTHWKFEEWRPRIAIPVNYTKTIDTRKKYIG